MIIEKVDCSVLCDNCFEDGFINSISIDDNWIYLCDECLQELNRKVVEYLAEKNL